MKTFFDLLFILNGTLGLLCGFLVILNRKKNKTVNIYLALIFFAGSTRLIFTGYIELTHNIELLTTIVRNNVSYLGIPLPYFYFRNLVFTKSIFKTSYLSHFLLPLLVTIEINYHLFEKVFQVDFTITVKTIILSIIVYYVVINYILLRKRYWSETKEIEFKTEHEKLMKKWTFVFFIAFLVSAITIIYDQLLLKDNLHISENFFTWITWLIVFIMILSSPSILNGYISQISRERDKGSKIISSWRLKPTYTITNPKDIQLSQKINGELGEYFIRITQFLEGNYLFRKSDFNIQDLALKSKIPISHLSFIFKYHSEISFIDFRKKERIKDAVALIEEGYLKTNTLESLSKTVGFNTYNSFFIGFKEITGKAPQNYVTTLTE
jgi:AraC-like DNA-binding protein